MVWMALYRMRSILFICADRCKYLQKKVYVVYLLYMYRYQYNNYSHYAI